jgi:hypothetical protein
VNNYKVLLATLCVALSVVLPGCGGGNGSGSGSSDPTIGPASSNVPQAQLQARLTPPGFVNAWPNAFITLSNIGASCNFTDPNCYTGPGSAYAGSDGNLDLFSDAIPGDWILGAAADSNCPSGAAPGGVFVATNPATVIPCGEAPYTAAVASPASCSTIVNENTGTTINTCPATITFTVPSPGLPMSPAMSVGYYTNAAAYVTSTNVSASTTTTITVPTPTTIGESVVAFVNPSTNQTVSAGLFTRTSSVILKTIPCPSAAEPAAAVASGSTTKATPDMAICEPVD